MRWACQIGWLVILFAAMGCGGVREAPVNPPFSAEGRGREHVAAKGRYLWACCEIRVDESGQGAQVIPLREAVGHWNVLKFLEQGPCTSCVKIVGVSNSGQGTKLFDVEITHPFASDNLTGFDVRGIAMFDGSHDFPVCGLGAPDRNLGDGELVNADGYTSLYNSSTEGSGPGGLQGYSKGKFASLDAPGAQLNGYKRHISPGDENTRCAFYAGDSVVETYEIDMPDGGFVFGYAVDVSWAPPLLDPVSDPISDFPPAANCPEPWMIETWEEPVDEGLTDQGGETVLVIDVYDRQGKGSHLAPVIECPEVFEGAVVAEWREDGDGFSRYQVLVQNELLAESGWYKCLVSAEDIENQSAPEWLDLTAYRIHPLRVRGEGWALTWGGTGMDQSLGIAMDSDGDVYVSGVYQGLVDFDPGDGYDFHQSNDVDMFGHDAFLSKFDSSGEFQWAVTWGGPKEDRGQEVAVDQDGGVYVTGVFEETVDFDPGSAKEERTSTGGPDVYLVKFNSQGGFELVATWGGLGEEWGLGVGVTPLGYAYVAGSFSVTVDFDPGPGVEERTSSGSADVFLSRFEPDGSFQWVRAWGGTDEDRGYGVDVDSSGKAHVAGAFSGTVDFDPGPGVDEHVGGGAFLSRFNPFGDFVWAETWEGQAWAVALGGSGDILVAGSSHGIGFRKLNSGGELQWERTVAGSDEDWCHGVGADELGNVYLAGVFHLMVDFNPGPDNDEHTSIGEGDVFLAKYNSSGEFLWARTWGGVGLDCGYALAVDGEGYAFTAGWFSGVVDFDPGSFVDERTSEGMLDAYVSRFTPEGVW